MDKRLSKPMALLVFTMLSIAVLLAGCGESGKSSASGEPAKVRLAIMTVAGGSLEFRTAKEQGFFQKYGIEPELSNFAYGINTVNAILTQQADTGLAADYALLNSICKGDLTIVSTLSRGNDKSAKDTVLFVSEGIRKPEDLAGKKLGVQKGTVYEYVWSKYLEKQQIPDSKIDCVPFNTPDEAVVALHKGQINAVWIGAAMADKFKAIKGVAQLGDLDDSGVRIKSYLLAGTLFVKEHPDAVGNVIQALNESMQYIPGHLEETAELALKELKLPKENVLRELKGFSGVIGFSQEDFGHLQNTKTYLEEAGILKEKFDLKDKIDLAPLQKVLPETVTYKG